jgi:hypothetical protein
MEGLSRRRERAQEHRNEAFSEEIGAHRRGEAVRASLLSSFLATRLQLAGVSKYPRDALTSVGQEGRMARQPRWHEAISVGFQVFAKDAEEEFGAIRDVCPGGREEFLVNIENGGDHCLPLSAIVDVHDEKVIVEPSRLPDSIRRLIKHAHDAEEPGL